MPSVQPNSTRAWEILVVNQEELAWFRDNLARVLCLLAYGELQAHLLAARVAQDGYGALASRVAFLNAQHPNRSKELLQDQALCFRLFVDQDGNRRQLTIKASCELDIVLPAPRTCRWPLGRKSVESFAQVCAKVDHQLDRKCRSQMTREMLEQNRELLRRLEAVNVAERAAEAKGAFLASMSHELRTPMNSILGFTRRLRRRLDGKIDARDLQALDVVSRNGNHLLSMINDILDFSKLEAEQERLSIEDVQVSAVVKSVLLQCDPLLAEGQRISFQDQAPQGFEISADGNKLGQILTNLVSNAIKYGAGKDIEVTLERQCLEKLGAVLLIEVRDQGKGMSAQEQARIFSPFTRLENDTTRAASGTGLGLAIASRYAKMHSGFLEVDSEVGKGSTFRLVVPETQTLPDAVNLLTPAA